MSSRMNNNHEHKLKLVQEKSIYDLFEHKKLPIIYDIRTRCTITWLKVHLNF